MAVIDFQQAKLEKRLQQVLEQMESLRTKFDKLAEDQLRKVGNICAVQLSEDYQEFLLLEKEYHQLLAEKYGTEQEFCVEPFAPRRFRVSESDGLEKS